MIFEQQHGETCTELLIRGAAPRVAIVMGPNAPVRSTLSEPLRRLQGVRGRERSSQRTESGIYNLACSNLL